MAKKNVLMIAHTFPPFGTVGGSIRLIKYLRYMDRGGDGWKPTVITLDEDQELLWLPKDSSFSLAELPDDIGLIRTKTSEPKVPNTDILFLNKILKKIKSALLMPLKKYLLIPDDKILWRSSLLTEANKAIRNDPYDLIYATAPPFSVLLSAVKLKQTSKLPLVLDIKDDWIADERYIGLKKWRRYIEKRMEARCIKEADRVITVTQKSCDDYKNRYPEYGDKFVTIPNGCDVSEYRKLWNTPPQKFSKFTLVHTGIFSARRDLSPFFRAMRRFIDDIPDADDSVEFIIVGRIPNVQERVIVSLNLQNNIRNIGYIERDQYVELLVKSHLPVVINYDVITLVPGKLYEYWGSRNRMLLLDNDNSAAADLVYRFNLGSVVNPSDEDKIYSELVAAFNAWKNGNLSMPETSGLAQFDREFLTRKLEAVFSEVI